MFVLLSVTPRCNTECISPYGSLNAVVSSYVFIKSRDMKNFLKEAFDVNILSSLTSSKISGTTMSTCEIRLAD